MSIEEQLEKETRWLMSLPEKQRTEYVNQVLESIAESIRRIASQPNNMEKLQMAKALFDELNKKSTTIIPPVIYAIRPEFQHAFIKILKEASNLLQF